MPCEFSETFVRPCQWRDTVIRSRRDIALVVLLLGWSHLTCPALKAETEPATPAPKAFRCALDDRPRMLVLDFGDGYFAAYDTEGCYLYKVWRGKVNLTGTVYDTKHGPRPAVRGEQLFSATQPSSDSPSNTPSTQPSAAPDLVPSATAPKPGEVRRWRGYTLKADAVVLSYADDSGKTVELSLSRSQSADSFPLVIKATPRP